MCAQVLVCTCDVWVVCFKTTSWHWGMLAMLQRRSIITKSSPKAQKEPTCSSITFRLTLMTANSPRPFALSVLSYQPKFTSTKKPICQNVLVSATADSMGNLMWSFSLILRLHILFRHKTKMKINTNFKTWNKRSIY